MENQTAGTIYQKDTAASALCANELSIDRYGDARLFGATCLTLKRLACVKQPRQVESEHAKQRQPEGSGGDSWSMGQWFNGQVAQRNRPIDLNPVDCEAHDRF